MTYMVLWVVCTLLVPALAEAQSVESGANTWRTSWGDPDLQGTWTNTTRTPFQRPLTDEERAEVNARFTRGNGRPVNNNTGAYNSFWLESGERTAQATLVTDPPEGRLPALTERVREMDAFFADARRGVTDPDSFTDVNLYDRCITRGLPGAMIPGFYNHNYQILQTPDHVVILVEMIHDARIVPLDGRAHLPPQIGQWLGDSRARWEGETLVVETTNFSPKADERALSATSGLPLVLGAGQYLRLVERFTRIDTDTIDYQFTVTDPTTYATPWSASIPMTALEGTLFEYACHEGNYGLLNILRGARARDQAISETSITSR